LWWLVLPKGLAARALHDRDALRELLERLGLDAHADRLAHDVAEVGLLLRHTRGRTAGSRLGGPALLPPGAEWPATEDGRPLSFLAGIDLAELPPGGGRPAAGWWLFFADLGFDDDDDPFGEPEDNRPGARGRLLPVPAGETPEPATPRGEELNHLPVAFAPMLTLPEPESAGLDVYARQAYEAALQALWKASGEPEWLGAQHWIGGHVPDAQGLTPEPGTVLLLHLADDAALGFGFLDAGTLQFLIPAGALARGDYGPVRAEPSSG
jgi:uncharacterized protein DUF1963